ncbi:MAG: hypothetical protein ABIJ08_04820 [Nanoarchaeota archaeon]
MKKAVWLILILLLPTISAQTCLDTICEDYVLAVWQEGDCREKLCTEKLDNALAPECYDILCMEDIIFFNPDCEIELCMPQYGPPNTMIETLPDEPIEEIPITTNDQQPISQQVSIQNTDSIDEEINNANQEIEILKTSINEIYSTVSQLQSSVKAHESSISAVSNMIGNAQEVQLSPKPISSTLYIIMGIIIFGLATVTTVNTIQIGKLNKPKLTVQQKNQLTSYVNHYLRLGYHIGSIKQSLLHQKWTQEQIDEALEALK